LEVQKWGYTIEKEDVRTPKKGISHRKSWISHQQNMGCPTKNLDFPAAKVAQLPEFDEWGQERPSRFPT